MLKTDSKSLRITIDVIDDAKMKIVKIEKIEKSENTFSTRQLNFLKDDTKQLISKLKNKKYEAYRTQILEILNKRYETAKKSPTDRNKKNLELISQL